MKFLIDLLYKRLSQSKWYNVSNETYAVRFLEGGDVEFKVSGGTIKLNVNMIMLDSIFNKLIPSMNDNEPINTLEHYTDEYLKMVLEEAEESEDFESCQRIKNELNERKKKRN